MTFRSKLFATVAFPVLSASLIATPALADALMKPFEVAQDSGEQAQPSEEELLLQRQQEEQRAAEEAAQRQAEEQQRAAEEEAQRAAEEQQRAAEQEAQRQAEEQQRAAEEEAQRQAAEQRRAADEEAQRAAEEQQKAADEEAQRAAAEQQKAAEEEAQRAAAEQQKAADEEAQRAAAEQQKAADEEAQRAAQEQQNAADEEAQRAAEEQQKAADAEAQRQADEQKAAEEQQQQTEQQQPAEEQPVEQQPAIVTDEQQQPAEGGAEQPATAETGETPAAEPVPEVVDTLSTEEKQAIAEDPGKTDETVVLPVENGAAVLDSDKDADNSGGRMSREERRKQREELRAQEEVPLPASDDSAQAEIPQEVREAVPQKIEAAIKEEGQRVDAAPVFAVPETTNIVNNTVINNTVINNNTVNNTVNNNTVENNVTQVNVVETIDNRTVLSVGNQLFVRGDDRPRLRRDSEEVYYDQLARGRTRETIVRPGGVQIITIYNRYGDVIQRSRVGRDGREYILVYAPELEDDAPRPDFFDVGYDLPPMRLRIPLRDYIVDTSSDPDRDYYEFLSEPPVERVERVYTINEVKQSARLRDKVRRIDLDTVTFATGSAEIPMSQARTLRKVADAMQKVLDKDPGETFLIEGHTDAVGSDKSNLVLSDRRADSVASLLTEVYGIPPENLQTQGYGERFLKVRTQAAEQQNRRVTIRRVTTLVRPVASAN
ncbi:OmpA family protein [Shinella sedimenti]|uniref:OmpA family protein n=1 Tax=Shinella sedimenti TaxID=2919913 RepID=A0ABT0CJM4_9HYPH|nr:OmpA family protein [Shinella sedimenti]MCJ8148798.1 OmpA family protein [Shinella sedimenti]